MEIKMHGDKGAESGMSAKPLAEEKRRTAIGKKKVLIIDDDSDYSWIMQTLLEGEGYDVCCAMTGSEGLKMAAAGKPDLIVLDVMMENLWAGYEINQALKFQSQYENLKHVPIIMVSSIEQPPAQRFFKSADAQMISPDAYFTKPVESKGFLETVRSLCPIA